MKKFLEFIEQNEELKAKVTVLDKKADAKPEDYIALAKEYGFELSEEDFVPVNNELSEEELGVVTGGKKCMCVAGGGGTGRGEYEDCTGRDFNELTCACVAAGAGEFWKEGEKYCRCVCVMAGGGEEAS